jgi:ferric-dicitrate binding protein FerR (iron transport regulator)
MISKQNKLKIKELEMIFCIEKLLNHITFPNVTDESRRNQNEIFEMINSRISVSESVKAQSFFKKISKSWYAAASIVITIGFGGYAYQLGYESGINKLSSSNIGIESPVNGTLDISLPDGSEVTLNGGSILSYPSFFAEGERRVQIEGEGYFDISTDNRPFIVETERLDVEVLGTRFNLKSYAEDDQIWLTLEKGAIKAHIRTDDSDKERVVALSPDEQVIFNKRSGDVSVTKVQTKLFTYWLSGGLFFPNNTLEEIMMVLENRFNMKIIIIDVDLKKETYYCQFDKNDDLSRILYLLSGKGVNKKNKWKYTILDGKVIISK